MHILVCKPYVWIFLTSCGFEGYERPLKFGWMQKIFSSILFPSAVKADSHLLAIQIVNGKELM
jgi:hypothetical protein